MSRRRSKYSWAQPPTIFNFILGGNAAPQLVEVALDTTDEIHEDDVLIRMILWVTFQQKGVDMSAPIPLPLTAWTFGGLLMQQQIGTPGSAGLAVVNPFDADNADLGWSWHHAWPMASTVNLSGGGIAEANKPYHERWGDKAWHMFDLQFTHGRSLSRNRAACLWWCFSNPADITQRMEVAGWYKILWAAAKT